MLKMTKTVVRSLNYKIIGIIVVIAIFPLLLNQAFAVPLADDQWAFKEQPIPTATAITCSIEGQFLSTSIASPLDLDTTTPQRGFCHIFKTFNKSQVINQNLNVTWAGTFSGIGLDHRITILDGAYDRTNATQFPSDVGLGFLPSQGGYTVFSFPRTGATPFTITSDVFNMTLATSILPQVTVSITLRDASTGNALFLDLFEISIGNVGIWNFDSTSLFTSEVTGTNLDFGFFTAGNFIDLQDFVPPVITLIGNNPETILKDSFYNDAGATALDNVSGDITGDIVTVNPVDSSIVATYQVTFNVVDGNNNPATEAIRTVNVVELIAGGDGGGSGFASPSLTGKGGEGKGISKLSDVEPLFTPEPTEPKTIDEVFDIFAQLNRFFSPTITERVEEVTEQVQETVTSEIRERIPEPATVRDSFFDRIRNFFSGLFGFLYGVQYAYGEMNVTERMMDYEMTQIGNYTYVHKFGLPQYIENATGDYVSYVHTEDANGVQLQTAQLTYYFDKSTCQMAIHSSGAMLPPPLIVDDNWVVKVAVNGTEIYSPISQNDLACVVTTTYLGESAKINSTKSDSNGIISEIYAFDPYKGLKHNLIFTNTNPSWNDHKFAWSNLMDDVPSTFAINTVDGVGDVSAQMYSLLSGANQPVEFNGDAIVLNYASSESVVYDVSDFLFNGTALVQGFNLYPPTASGNDRISYFFKDAIDKLSTVEFYSNPDQTIDVVVNYQNVTQPLAINSTMNLDPTTTFSGLGDRSLSLPFGGSGFHCGRTSSTTADLTTVGVASVSQSGASIACTGTYAHFNIASIPDDATPTRLRLSINVTSGSCSGTQCNLINPARIFEIYDEDISQFSFVDMASILSVPTDTTVCKGGFACVVDKTSIGNFGNTPTSPTFPFVRAIEATLASDKFIIDFEDQLESGKDFFDFLMCIGISVEGGGTNRGGCRGIVGVPVSNSNSMVWELVNPLTFFEVEFEVFTTPSAPPNVSAVHSPSPDKCFVDWDIPLDDGGRTIDGYQIERNINGGSFTTLVADTGLPSPTDHSDTTIVTNESYFYRISAINQEGVGSGGTSTASCGIPSIADPPTLVNVFEQPSTDITLDWVLGYDGGLPILGYKIERSVNTGSFNILIATTGNQDVTFIDATAGFNVINTYRISTINSLGTSTPSNELGFTIVVAGGGGAVGAGGQAPVGVVEEEVGFDQEAFDQALAEAIASIPLQQVTVFEQIVSTFFEFAVVDNTHPDLVLNSILDNERLGIRWSSGQDIVVVSAIASPSPFLITFEQLPAVKQGSGAVISTDFILYNLQVPRTECVGEVTFDCVQKVRYEVPVTVNAVINGTNVSDIGTITVDLVDEIIDPILLLILATFGIPLAGVFIQRSRGRSGTPPVRDVFKT